jgi:glucose uptake protein
MIAVLLLGIWSSTFKMAGSRWRYELFSFDFAIGAMLFALISAYTVGKFGTDLGFSEHLMLSSKTNEALAFFAGGLFALGNLLLLAGIALVGLSFAYAIGTASAIIVLCALEFSGFRALFLAISIGTALLTIIFEAIGANSAEETLPGVNLPVMVRVRKSASGRPTVGKAPQVKQGMKIATKGIMVSILGGLFIGGSLYPFSASLLTSLGLGTFAGVVVFFAGALGATLVAGFLLMNAPIHGGPTTFKNYLRGPIGKHVLGVIGGVLCAAAVLVLTLLYSLKEDVRPDPLWLWAGALGASVLAAFLGLTIWRELSQAPGAASRSLVVGVLLLVAAIGALAVAMDKTPPLPSTQSKLLPQAQLPG